MPGTAGWRKVARRRLPILSGDPPPKKKKNSSTINAAIFGVVVILTWVASSSGGSAILVWFIFPGLGADGPSVRPGSSVGQHFTFTFGVVGKTPASYFYICMERFLIRGWGLVLPGGATEARLLSKCVSG